MRTAEKRSEIAAAPSVSSNRCSPQFDSVAVENKEGLNEISDEKTLLMMPAFVKISSRTISGDFGVPVACAYEHHFFLDITFY